MSKHPGTYVSAMASSVVFGDGLYSSLSWEERYSRFIRPAQAPHISTSFKSLLIKPGPQQWHQGILPWSHSHRINDKGRGPPELSAPLRRLLSCLLATREWPDSAGTLRPSGFSRVGIDMQQSVSLRQFWNCNSVPPHCWNQSPAHADLLLRLTLYSGSMF